MDYCASFVPTVDPRISDPRISDPRISDPRISDPRISDLFCEADMTSRTCLRKRSDHVAVMATIDKGKKRRRVVLTINEKVEILQLLETSSRTAIATKYGVGKTTITDIKRNRDKILGFKRETTDMGQQRS